MSAVWQVQQAKNHFSELIERAVNEGPQTITRHGRPVVRVVAVGAAAEAQTPHAKKLPRGDDGFVEFLLSAPKIDGFELPERSSIKPIDPIEPIGE